MKKQNIITYIIRRSTIHFLFPGAKVVPIPTDLPKDELREMFDSVNGLLFPGGGQVREFIIK